MANSSKYKMLWGFKHPYVHIFIDAHTDDVLQKQAKKENFLLRRQPSDLGARLQFIITWMKENVIFTLRIVVFMTL